MDLHFALKAISAAVYPPNPDFPSPKHARPDVENLVGQADTMLWRIRTTLADRPGILAEIALACGRSGVNILGMQVFPTSPRVTDEFIVSAPEGWGDVQLAELFAIQVQGVE